MISGKHTHIDMAKELCFGDHFARIVRTDSKFQFIAFLRKQLDNPGETISDISKSELLKSICLHRAVECATVLLQGETGVNVDLNVVIEGGFTPLQLAARSLSSRLTELFLRHGAEANMCSQDGSKDLAMLPLNLALNALCHHEFISDWTPEKSIYKLFYIFCLPDLKDALDTIHLLASKTEDIEKTSVYDVVEVIQVAALVMVSWGKIIAPFLENGVEVSPIWQHIRRQLGTVAYQEAEHLTTRYPNPVMLEFYKNKAANLLAQLEVLKVPAAVYDLMEKFRHSDIAKDVLRHKFPFEIASNFFDNAALVLKPDDVCTNDIKCLRFKVPKEVKDRLNENLEKEMASAATMSRPIRLCEPNSEIDAVKVLTKKDLGRNPDLSWLVENALERDDKDDFVKSIYSWTAKDPSKAKEYLSLICGDLFNYDAVKCATAVLAGETADVFDFRNFRGPPLHEAARKCAARITELLLNDGSFSANADFKDDLPLEVVLERVNFNVNNSKSDKDSAVRILSVLCLPCLRDTLETVRLLARSTDQLKHLFLSYLNGGKIAEVAALLLVSRDELLLSTGDDFDFKNVADIHSYLLTNAYFSDGNLNTEMARLLKIFDRIGNKLDAFIRLDAQLIHHTSLEVASLVEDAGFHVKSEDIDSICRVYSSRIFSFHSLQLPIGRPNDEGIIRVPAEDLYEPQASMVTSYYETLAKNVAFYVGSSNVQHGFGIPQFSRPTSMNFFTEPSIKGQGEHAMSYPGMRRFPFQGRVGLINRSLRYNKDCVSLRSNSSTHAPPLRRHFRSISSMILSRQYKPFQIMAFSSLILCS